MQQLQAIKAKSTSQPDARRDTRSPAALASEHDRWMALQRGIGNQAVSQMLQRQAVPAAPIARTDSEPTSAPTPEFARQILEPASDRERGPRRRVRISKPGDVHEREADRVADQVMSASPHPRVGKAPPRLQRFADPSNGQSNAGVTSVDQVRAGSGNPMEPALRDDMEQRFGHDFSHVRVHSDGDAEQSARDVNAQAYTVGNDIIFGKGRYAPETSGGRWLLAHELTHVIQQSESNASFVQRQVRTDKNEWTVVTQIIVQANTTGEGRGRALTTGGQTIPINIQVNKLDAGHTYVLGAPDLQPHWDSWSRVHMESITAQRFVYDLPPGVTLANELTVIVGPKRRSVAEVWKDIQALPKDIQELVINPKEGRAAGAAGVQDYETALRIGQKLASAGVTSDEIYDFVKTLHGNRRYTEANIDTFLAERSREQKKRKQNLAGRQKSEAKLFGREDLYKRYVALYDLEARFTHLGNGHSESELYQSFIETRKSRPDLGWPDITPTRVQLQLDLIAAGFPDDIADLESFVQNYEKTFERETLAIAYDVLRKYEHYLNREQEKLAPGEVVSESEARKVLGRIETIRQPAQKLYFKAEIARGRAAGAEVAAPYEKTREKQEEDEREQKEELQKAAEYEKQAAGVVASAVPEHAILGWQDFPREKLLRRTKWQDISWEMRWFIDTHIAAIQRARKMLEDKPQRIYELDNLLAVSYKAQDIKANSIFDLIVRNRIKRVESEKSVKEILLAVITIALTIVTLGGGTLGLVAAGAIFGIGLAQAADALEKYDDQTTLYMSQLLSEKPSEAWAILAVIGTGLDALTVMHALEVVVPAAEAFREAGDLEKLENALAKVDVRIREQVLEAAKQVRVAERELKAASGELKEMFKRPSRLLFGSPSTVKSVAVPGGELAGNLVSITYYYVKSRVLKSFPRFVEQLEKDGLIVWAQLAAEDQMALRKAFEQAIELGEASQLPFSTPIYQNLSEQARQVFPAETVDRLVAEGKGLGRSDAEIIEQLESEAIAQPAAPPPSPEAVATDLRARLGKFEEDQQALEGHRDSLKKELVAEIKRNDKLKPGIAQKFKPTQAYLDSSKRVEELKAGLAQADKDVIEHALKIKQLEGELALVTKPWRQASLVGATEAETNFRVGLFGELEMSATLQEQGWEAMGSTFKPSDILSPKHFEDAVKRYRGRTGIDGVYRRVRNGQTEYLVAESKATLDPHAELATGKGLLSATENGDQLSKKWIRGNLHKTNLSPAEIKEIEVALGDDKVHLVYAQTRGSETNFFRVGSPSDTEATIVGIFDVSE